MSKTEVKIENQETIIPKFVALSVVKFDLEGKVFYGAQLVLVVDADAGIVRFVPTSVCEETAHEATKRALRGSMWLFDGISSHVEVIDSVTGDVLDQISLNETFPDWKTMDDAAPAASPTLH